VPGAELAAESASRVELVTPERQIGRDIGATNIAIHLRNLYREGVILTPDQRLKSIERSDAKLKVVLCNEYSDETSEREVDQVVIECGTLAMDDVYFELLDISLPVKNILQQKIAFEDREKAIPRDMPFSVDLDARTLDWTDENWPLIGPMGVDGAFMVGALSGFGTMAACAAGSLCASWVSGSPLPDYAFDLSLARYRDKVLMTALQNSSNRGVL